MYPQPFADKIKELLPNLCGGGGKPDLGVNIDPEDAYTCFSNLPWETWSEAHLIPVLRYLKGNKHLVVPAEWKAVFPDSVLPKMENQAPDASSTAACSEGPP